VALAVLLESIVPGLTLFPGLVTGEEDSTGAVCGALSGRRGIEWPDSPSIELAGDMLLGGAWVLPIGFSSLTPGRRGN
jgi:hypothetical protein